MRSWDNIRDALGLLDVPHDKAKTIEEIGKELGFTDKVESNRFFQIELEQQGLVQIVRTTKDNIKLYTISAAGRNLLEQERRDYLQRELADLQHEQVKIGQEQTKISDEQNKISKGQKSSSDRENLLMGVLVIVTVIGILWSWHMDEQQLDVFKESVEKQKELSDKQIAALAPIEPNVTIFVDPKDIIFYDVDLSRHYLDEKGNIKASGRGTLFEWIVRNTGQSDTGTVRITGLDNIFHIYQGVDEYNFKVSNINGLSSISNYSVIFLKNCAGNAPPGFDGKPCTPDAVPNGTHNISFEIYCAFCNPQIKIQNFTMCVWRESSLECEK